jgi:hypothetical protein
MWADGDRIETTYDRFRVYALTVIRNGKTEYVTKDVKRFHPTYTEFLNSQWSQQWGKLYNIDAVANYRKDIENRLRFTLWDPFRRQGIIASFGDFLFRLLDRPFVLNSVCWISLLLRIHKLPKE